MLVLARKETERLVFPTLGISIEVIHIRGKKTRLGIDAPADVPVLRHELADLKGIDFTSGGASANQKCSNLAMAVRTTLDSTAVVLNRLHAHLDGHDAAQSLVLDVFRELQVLDCNIDDTLEDSHGSSPHALLIDNDANERELLASCLRLGGFEVVIASNADDALGYLSLHSRPDFALIDSASGDETMIDQLRSTDACAGMKFIGLGDNRSGIDRWFARPINAEQLVDELTREFGVIAV
ncbi:MAG TPA: carbon storage regulator [Pirellulaceae bacterium]|jgi:carbon storage regulator CsrA|nr:carbon storage regulator [Pirellulaceae bacterium]